MKIRLGSIPFKKETKDRIPNNQGMVEHANQELDYVVDTANQAYINALAVDGVEFMLFRKCKEGRMCTCKRGTEETVDVNSRFNEFDTPQPASQDMTIRTRGSWDRQNKKPNAFGKELGVEIGRIEADDGSDDQYVKQFPQTEQQEIEEFLQAPLDTRLLQGGDSTTACGICLGTGYTNGYSLYNGVRVTFDSINVTRSKSFTIDKEERPYSFKTSGDAVSQYVEWSWEVPRYFKEATAILVRNNLNSADGVQIVAKGGDDIDFVPLTKYTIQQYKGQTIKLRVVPFNVTRSTVEFTHVEIILQFNDWPVTQVGQFQESSNQGAPEAVAELEFNFPPSIDKISNNDVIVEFKYNKAWILNGVTDLQTAKFRVLNWTGSGRSLTTFDILSLLKLSRYNNYSISWDGLEGDDEPF